MDQWPVLGGAAGLLAMAIAFLWRTVKQGIEQEERLLKPAYERIDELERRLEAVEVANADCHRRLGRALFALAVHGIEVPE